jgi:hypothetical protein
MKTRMLQLALLSAAGITFIPAAPDLLAQVTPRACCSRFDYVLEKTFLKVDAVRLELNILNGTPARVTELIDGSTRDAALEDSVAEVYLSADGAELRMTFLVSFGLERFLDGNRDTLNGLAEAGIISGDDAERLYLENRQRFAVLAESGIQEGDRLEHELRGDTITTRFTDVSGVTQIDEIRVGPERRAALLGSFFGRESDFRDGLLDQVFDR